MNASDSSAAVQRSFGRAAGTYRTYAGVQAELARWTAEWAPAAPDRLGMALELGAGTGLFTELLLPWRGGFVATDLSSEMCAAGRARFHHIPWRQASAEAPPPGPWNWIFTSSMLQWLADPAAALAACGRTLAPGGRLLAGLFVSPTLAEWTETLGLAESTTLRVPPEPTRRAGVPLPVQWRTPKEWTDALNAARLRLLRSEARTVAFEFPSAHALLRSLHGTGAAPHRRLAPAILRRLLADYDERHRSPAGVRSTWTLFRFEATN